MGDRIVHLGYGKDGKKLHGFSGRLVRVRDVPPETLEQIEIAAAQELKPESNMAEFHARIARHGINAMVTGVSDPCEPKDVPHAKDKLRKLTAAEMDKEHNALFTPKDQILLKQEYDRNHTVTQKELDAIMGGAIGVVD